MTVTILQGNCIEVLKTLDAGSVQTCVTSPPYYGLRNYGTARWEGGDAECDHKSTKKKSRFDYPMQEGSRHEEIAKNTNGTDGSRWKNVCPACGAQKIDDQIGLEETPEVYVEKLVQVFREVWRVLTDDGVLWLNLGDSYAGSGGAGGDYNEGGLKEGQPRYKSNMKISRAKDRSTDKWSYPKKYAGNGIKPKDIIGIPWMVAFALRADGWYLRSDIIWNKSNPMPESVTDRPTKAHEYIFLLSKNAHYYYDYEAIQEIATGYDGRKDTQDTQFKGSVKYKDSGQTFAKRGHERWHYKNLQYAGQKTRTIHEKRLQGEEYLSPVRNKRSVWTVATKPYKEAHFAVFPPKLIEPCILAGSREGDTVLDPFNGSGTTGAVAIKHHRNYIGIELNPEYIELTRKRLNGVQPVLFEASA